jgi:hypothetical protein
MNGKKSNMYQKKFKKNNNIQKNMHGMPIFKPPKQRLETYCFCSVSSSYYYYYYYYYYYITQTVVGWCIAILRFFFTIIIIIIIIILPHIFVRSISRRCLDQTLWNLVGISYAMWSCAV